MKVKTVLIIDDEPGFTNIVRLTLEATHNYKVFAENDPRKALQTAHRVAPDIILLDMIMPCMDGGDVRLQLSADPVLKHVPVVFVTGIIKKSEVDEHAGIIGGECYISKPVSVDGLIRVIEQHFVET